MPLPPGDIPAQSTERSTSNTLPPEVAEDSAPDRALELCHYLINRYDSLRMSTANRVSVLLSGETVLLAGLAVLSATLKPGRLLIGNILAAVSAVLIVLTLIVVVWSARQAFNVLVSTRSSRSLYGEIPNRGAYNHADVVRSYASYGEFERYLDTISLTDQLATARAELWTCIRQHYLRYQALRSAVKLAFSALILFLAASACSLAVALLGAWS
jgi:hypothetical protein